VSDPSNQAKSIFLAAIEQLAPEQWPGFLDQACAGDVRLRADVEKLLRAHSAMGSFHEPPQPASLATVDGPTSGEQPGTVIGPYKLLQPIGEGGMGTVYMAEQTVPVRRLVALKVIKAGLDSRHVLARFGAERQALALMDHPNIAKVLDAGTTDAGRPYFVMELVKGVPITRFCDEHGLSTRERLELAMPVCQAIQHAHQKGVIHRDLKPSNILVALYDDKPVPKVIDFGVAKATGRRLSEETLYTEFGAVVGTLEYMSPEQAQLNQLDIDTRSDIYSLGVLLYELLTGSTPLDRKRLKEAAFLEVLRVIREEESPRPSMRLSTTEELPSIAACRSIEPRKLSGLLRRELDWIVMKALEKDRNRRYETANELARDVERYLHDEPVLACPPSAWYRFRKFTRRHKAGLRIAAAAALVLLLAVGGVTWALWDRATRRTELSKRMAETEQTVNAALIQTDQWGKQAGEATGATSQEADAVLALWRQAGASLAQAETALKTGTAGDRLRQRVRDVQEQLERGRTQAERKAALFRDLDEARMTRSILTETHFDYAGAATKYAAAFAAYGLELKPGRTDELALRVRAEQPAMREALVVALDDWRDVAARAKTVELANLVWALAAAVDDDPWRRRYRAAATARGSTALRALSGEAHRLTLPPSSLHLLAMSLNSQDAPDEAMALLRWARGRHLTDFWIHFELGSLLEHAEDKSPVILEEAIGCYRTALALRPAAGAAHNNLGNCLHHRKQRDEAMAEYRKAIDLDPRNSVAHTNVGDLLGEKNQLDEAMAEYRKAIDLDPKYATAHHNLGLTLYHKNQLDEAIIEYRKAIDLDPKNALAHNNLGGALQAKNQSDEAMAEYRKAIDLDPKYAPAHNNLGNVLRAKNQLDEATAEFRTAFGLDPTYAVAHFNLGLALRDKNQLDEAMAEYRQAINLDPKLARAYFDLGNALRHKGRLDDAVAEYKKAIDLRPDHAEPHCNLADIFRLQGQLSASLDFYKRGHALGTKRHDWHYPSAQWVADAERRVQLEAKLADILAGKVTATDQGELPGLLEVCRLQRRHAAAARLYADAFTADPKLGDDLSAFHRYNAACCAALAAAGQGTDADNLDDQEQSRLRQQASAWLRADLEQWSKQREGGNAEDRQVMRDTLVNWQRDTDLAGVRDAAALKNLPAQEQESWRKLWADIAELVKKAGNAS